MASIPTARPMTIAELEQLPECDRFRYELRHGELVRVPPPKHIHFLIQRRLRRALEAIAGDTGVVDIEIAFRAEPEHEYRVADVAFVSRERWEHTDPGDNLRGAPDLVIEVLSPSNTASEILDKEALCLANGSREFWIVDPERRQVRVSDPSGRTVTYKSGQEIPLFFGSSVAVDAIFD